MTFAEAIEIVKADGAVQRERSTGLTFELRFSDMDALVDERSRWAQLKREDVCADNWEKLNL